MSSSCVLTHLLGSLARSRRSPAERAETCSLRAWPALVCHPFSGKQRGKEDTPFSGLSVPKTPRLMGQRQAGGIDLAPPQNLRTDTQDVLRPELP